MRIIAGSLGGRQFDAPHGHKTHPMSDKARGALFNALGDVEGLTVLDAFAGSGAISLEAISRGASHVVAIDSDQNANLTIKQNIAKLGVQGRIKAIKANSGSWSANNPDQQFDIVVTAPPYDNLQPALVSRLAGHLKPDGLYILDWPGKQDLPAIESLQIVDQKNYGDVQLVFYKRTG